MSGSSGDRFIVLFRHGLAEDARAGQSDEERALTPEGHARMKQSGRGLERVFPKAEAIFSSPLLRSMQTALWIAKGYRLRIAVEPLPLLAPGGPVEDFREMVLSSTHRKIVFVGHEPDMSQRVAALLHAGVTRFELNKGACYGVRVDAHGRGLLEWMLSPRVLRKLGE